MQNECDVDLRSTGSTATGQAAREQLSCQPAQDTLRHNGPVPNRTSFQIRPLLLPLLAVPSAASCPFGSERSPSSSMSSLFVMRHYIITPLLSVLEYYVAHNYSLNSKPVSRSPESW